MNNNIVVDGTIIGYSLGTRTITLNKTIPKESLLYVFNVTQNKLYYAGITGYVKATFDGTVITIDGTFSDIVGTDIIHIQVFNVPEYNTAGVSLGTSITLTSSFVDIGGEIKTLGFKTLTLFIVCTVNASTEVQFEILNKLTLAGAYEYTSVVYAPNASKTNLYPEIIAIPGTSNFIYAISYNLNDTVPYIQIQGKDITSGSHAVINDIKYTLGY